jgi:hypothetical protein
MTAGSAGLSGCRCPSEASLAPTDGPEPLFDIVLCIKKDFYSCVKMLMGLFDILYELNNFRKLPQDAAASSQVTTSALHACVHLRLEHTNAY